MKSGQEKLVGLDNIDNIANRPVVLCYGSFEVIHPGHIRYLTYARALGSFLAVAVKANARNDATTSRVDEFSHEERCLGVAAIELVDGVIPLTNNNLEDAVRHLKPETLLLGKEFENDDSLEINGVRSALESFGGQIAYHSGEVFHASADLFAINHVSLDKSRLDQYRTACQQQHLAVGSLLDVLDRLSQVSVLIIGDTIVDQYVACDAVGMSAEAPIIVVRELESRNYLGGSGIVAAHSRALGARSHYLSVVGDDLHADTVRQQLDDFKVDYSLINDISRPTTLKKRYLVDHQKVFRVSKIKEHGLQRDIEDQLIAELYRLAPDFHGILISDFVYGVITPRVLEAVKHVALTHGIMLFGDLQCSSQIGNVAKFVDFDLLCPTEREARIALSDNEHGIEWISTTLRDQTRAKNLLMKMGSDGFIAYEPTDGEFVRRQHFPAMTANPADVVGAGDALLALSSVCLSSGASLMEAASLGAVACSLAVREMGNVPISAKAIQANLREIFQ